MLATIIILAVLFVVDAVIGAGSAYKPIEDYKRLEDWEPKFRTMYQHYDKEVNYYKYVA